MPAPRFRDDQWDRIYRLLSAQEGLYIRQEAETRQFVETVLWIARAGCAWPNNVADLIDELAAFIHVGSISALSGWA